MHTWIELADATLESCREDASSDDTRSAEAIVAQSRLIDSIFNKRRRERTGKVTREQIQQQLAEEAQRKHTLGQAPTVNYKGISSTTSPTATSIFSSPDMEYLPGIHRMRGVVAVGFENGTSCTPQKLRRPYTFKRTSTSWKSPLGLP